MMPEERTLEKVFSNIPERRSVGKQETDWE